VREADNLLKIYGDVPGGVANAGSAYLDTVASGIVPFLSGKSEGQAATDEEVAHLPVEHETPGGLNFRNRTGLEQAGWFDALYNQLQDTYSNANLKAKSSE
jgi:hypothetical protein